MKEVGGGRIMRTVVRREGVFCCLMLVDGVHKIAANVWLISPPSVLGDIVRLTF